MAKITVYIPTRNRSGLLARALASLVGQTFRDWQCIVVDDGSDDDTPQVIDAFARDSRFRSIRFTSAQGACAARNAAIEQAQTTYVTGLDDDDMFLPNRLQDLLSHRENYGVASFPLIASVDVVVGPQQATISKRPAHVPLSAILRRNALGNQALMATDQVRSVGGFDVTLPSSQDHDLWTRLIAKNGPAVVIRKPGQVIFEDNVTPRITQDNSARVRGMKRFFEKHRGQMQARQAYAYQARYMSLEKHPISLAYAILGAELSIEGAREVLRAGRNLLR